MRAFVLSGGGAHGDFQLGALRYLYDQGILPQLVVSTSIGSVHAVKLAEGGAAPLVDLERIWGSLTRTDQFYVPRPWVGRLARAVGSTESDLVRLLGSLPALAVSPFFGPGAIAGAIAVVVADAIGLAIDIAEVRSIITEMLTTETSLYDLAPLEALLRRHVDAPRVASSGVRLRMCVVELESGRVRYVTERATFSDDDSRIAPDDVASTGGHPLAADDPGAPRPHTPVHVRRTAPLWRGALASAAIPAFFPVVSLSGNSYVDGGVREILPIRYAVESGADEIWAISAGASSIEPAPAPRGLFSVGERALDIATNEILRDEAHPFNGWPVPVRLIEPTFSIHSSMEIVAPLIEISRDYGWMRAEDLMSTLRPPMTSVLGRPFSPYGVDPALPATAGRAGLVAAARGLSAPVPRADYVQTSDQITRIRKSLHDLAPRIDAAGDVFAHVTLASEEAGRELRRAGGAGAPYAALVAERRRLHDELRRAIAARLSIGLHLPPGATATAW